MEVFLVLIGALIAIGVGYAEGCMFDIFFGFLVLLVGTVYGLIKILLHNKR